MAVVELDERDSDAPLAVEEEVVDDSAVRHVSEEFWSYLAGGILFSIQAMIAPQSTGGSSHELVFFVC